MNHQLTKAGDNISRDMWPPLVYLLRTMVRMMMMTLMKLLMMMMKDSNPDGIPTLACHQEEYKVRLEC